MTDSKNKFDNRGFYTKALNKNTKKAQELISNYRWHIDRYGERTLWNIYARPSFPKMASWHDIEWMCERMRGHGLTALGHNCMKYSAAFIVTENGKEKLFYFTADNTYEIEL